MSLPSLTKALKVSFDSKDYVSAEKILLPIKIELVKNQLLVPDVKKAATNSQYASDLVIARSILEMGALVSINLDKFAEFENYLAQVKAFYSLDLPQSENKNKLIALGLLLILSKGDVTKFHIELESGEINTADEYLSYPVKLERWLMEGSYNHVVELLNAKKDVAEFNIFNETLMDAIREELANNAEVSYKSLNAGTLKALFFFHSESEVAAFAEQRGWQLQHGVVTFDKAVEALTSEESVSSTEKLIQNTLSYAIGMETIV